MSFVALQAILVATVAAGVLGAAMGATLLFVPRRYLDQPSTLRRLLLETNLGELFDRRYAIERRIYRRHRIFGLLVVAGALAGIGLLWYLSRQPASLAKLYRVLGRPAVEVALLAAGAVGMLLLVVGACLVIRPSVLKGIEAASNRWIDPIPIRRSHAMVSRLVLRAPRIVGAALLAVGIACLRPF